MKGYARRERRTKRQIKEVCTCVIPNALPIFARTNSWTSRRLKREISQAKSGWRARNAPGKVLWIRDNSRPSLVCSTSNTETLYQSDNCPLFVNDLRFELIFGNSNLIDAESGVESSKKMFLLHEIASQRWDLISVVLNFVRCFWWWRQSRAWSDAQLPRESVEKKLTSRKGETPRVRAPLHFASPSGGTATLPTTVCFLEKTLGKGLHAVAARSTARRTLCG